MRNSSVKEALDEINGRLDSLFDLFYKLSGESLSESLMLASARFKDMSDDSKKNISTLQMMTNELKGVVAMSRAALDEGRKFTGLIELPRLLDAWTVQYQGFMDKMIDISQSHAKFSMELDSLIDWHVRINDLIFPIEENNG